MPDNSFVVADPEQRNRIGAALTHLRQCVAELHVALLNYDTDTEGEDRLRALLALATVLLTNLGDLFMDHRDASDANDE